MLVNLGPQHPSTHGVLRVVIKIDGERVVDLDPVLGYLHRGVEKICENGDWHHAISNCDPLEYIASMFSEAMPVIACEKLLDLQVPRRADYIRVLAWELNRISSHALFIGWLALDLGGLTPILYGFIERDEIVEMLAALTGQQLLFNYLRIGGVNGDLNHEFLSRLGDWMGHAGKRIEAQQKLHQRERDLRRPDTRPGRHRPRHGAPDLPHRPRRCAPAASPTTSAAPTRTASTRSSSSTSRSRTEGDAYARYLLHIDEIKQSIHIIDQVLHQMPDGPVMAKIPRLHARRARAGPSTPSRAPAASTRCYAHERRHRPAVPAAHPRPVVLQPPGGRPADARQPDRRHHGDHGQPRPDHGRHRQMSVDRRAPGRRLTPAGKVVLPLLIAFAVNC